MIQFDDDLYFRNGSATNVTKCLHSADIYVDEYNAKQDIEIYNLQNCKPVKVKIEIVEK